MTTTSSKIWQIASLILTIGGISLMAVGGWIFVQRQIEASQPPPARILEVSVDDLEPTATAVAARPTTGPVPATPTAAPQTTAGDTLANESAQPTAEATTEPVEEAAPEPTQEPDTAPAESGSLVEARLVEETSLSQESNQTPAPTSEPAHSLADNPLPVVVDDEQPAAEPDTTEGQEPATEATGLPLKRLVAKAIDLDTEVVEVGWRSVEQNGVSTNVWVVADYAAGWHQNSMLPGQGGNIVFSAHHNIKGEVFRYIVDLEPGNVVTLYDEAKSYDYVVEDKFIVKDKGEPEAVRRANAKWIGPFNEERLTLVTCWPYNNNTHRLIVIAKPAG